MLTSAVSVSTEASELLDLNHLSGDRGEIAEIMIRVVDSVEGYSSGNSTHCYRDLRCKDPRLSRRLREFATTGVLLRLRDPWFAGHWARARKAREEVAEALAAVLAREHNIAPSEIRTAHCKISVFTAGGAQPVDDAVVIFDDVVGGLRLTSPLFTTFDKLLDRLQLATELASGEALLGCGAVTRLRDWYESLKGKVEQHDAAQQPPAQLSLPEPALGEVEILAPGSIAGIRLGGDLQERRLLAPELKRIRDDEVLGYRYEARPGTRAWVPHDRLVPLGEDWKRALWSPGSATIREIAA
jgi:DEAD/DEAH box helicase domain-containing protein